MLVLMPILTIEVYGDEIRNFFLTANVQDAIPGLFIAFCIVISYGMAAWKIIDMDIEFMDEICEKINKLDHQS